MEAIRKAGGYHNLTSGDCKSILGCWIEVAQLAEGSRIGVTRHHAAKSVWVYQLSKCRAKHIYPEQGNSCPSCKCRNALKVDSSLRYEDFFDDNGADANLSATHYEQAVDPQRVFVMIIDGQKYANTHDDVNDLAREFPKECCEILWTQNLTKGSVRCMDCNMPDCRSSAEHLNIRSIGDEIEHVCQRLAIKSKAAKQ